MTTTTTTNHNDSNNSSDPAQQQKQKGHGRSSRQSKQSKYLFQPNAMRFRTMIGAYSHRIVSSVTPVQQAKELAAKAHQLFEDMHLVHPESSHVL